MSKKRAMPPLAVLSEVVDPTTESYLATLAENSTIWKRRGRHGAVCFIDGVIEALMATGAISNAEASKWNIAIMSSSSGFSSRFAPPVNTAKVPNGRDAPQDFPHFLELIPVRGAIVVIPDVCRVQILGIERYDSKAAIVWRVVPLPSPTKLESFSHFTQFETGPNSKTTEIADDVGTQYTVVGGHSGGRIERVGRFEFQPAPPDNATLLFVRWEDAAFDLVLPRAGHSKRPN
jgi:hypothetical protein